VRDGPYDGRVEDGEGGVLEPELERGRVGRHLGRGKL